MMRNILFWNHLHYNYCVEMFYANIEWAFDIYVTNMELSHLDFRQVYIFGRPNGYLLAFLVVRNI